MTRYTQHKVLDILLHALVLIILWQAGAGYWSLIVTAYGVWCFYDGLWRIHLRKEHEAIKNVETTYRQTSNETTK